jgi:hypothetical protein
MTERRKTNANDLVLTSTWLTCDDSDLAGRFLVAEAEKKAPDVQLVFSLLVGKVGEVLDGFLLFSCFDLRT